MLKVSDIVVDEWLFDSLSPHSNTELVEMAHVFIWTIKKKCDRMIFSPEHRKRCDKKVNRFKSETKDISFYPLVLRPLTLLLHDAKKAELRQGSLPSPVSDVIPNDDHPLLRSAFAITSKKLIVTTDERLGKIVEENLGDYELECISPQNYIKRNN